MDVNQLHMEAACTLRLHVYVLDSDGALLDACLMAAAGALLSLRLPCPKVNEDNKVLPVTLSRCALHALCALLTPSC